MPELPELEVVRDVLQKRVIDEIIPRVQAIQPGAAIVIRDLTGAGAEKTLHAAHFNAVQRRGKFLVLTCSTGAETLYMVINPKLTGRLQLATPSDKKLAKTHLILPLSGGKELRYVDQKQMGQVYLTRKPPAEAGIPDFTELGPEPFEVTLDEFRQRLRKFQGEIKGILIRGEFIAGIGNAYADEVLWQARLHPYRKRTSLSEEEIAQLYEGMRSCLRNAIQQVRAEIGENIHRESRNFLNVHMKTNQPCPRCGGMISEGTANQRVTNFCRTCQPGGLIKGM